MKNTIANTLRCSIEDVATIYNFMLSQNHRPEKMATLLRESIELLASTIAKQKPELVIPNTTKAVELLTSAGLLDINRTRNKASLANALAQEDLSFDLKAVTPRYVSAEEELQRRLDMMEESSPSGAVLTPEDTKKMLENLKRKKGAQHDPK